MGNTTSDPLRPQRPPISGNEGLQALYRAESIDNYISQVNQSVSNRIARAGMLYLASPHSVQRSVPSANPKDPWPNGQVIWMDPSADGGLPHTRPPFYICISRDFPEDKFEKTLLHERIHVSQKLHSREWISIIEKAWSMNPWVGELPRTIQDQRRINPDLLMAPLFAWKNEWVPLAIFKSTSKPKLSEVDLIWWNTKTKTLFRTPPPGWTDFFGSNPLAEHPFEIAAYLIADKATSIPAYRVLLPYLSNLPTKEN